MPGLPALCAEPDGALLRTLQQQIADGDTGAADKTASALSEGARCELVVVARFALAGWRQAREAAAEGGAAEVLTPVLATIDALGKRKRDAAESKDEGLGLQVEYVQAALRAAMAAAQDERAEMALWLDHARDLVQRLEERQVRAVWPRPFNVLAGELWFEVDRYQEARDAYARAVPSGAVCRRSRRPRAIAIPDGASRRSVSNAEAGCQPARDVACDGGQ